MRIRQRSTPGFSTLFAVIVLSGAALALALTLLTSSVWSLRGNVDARRYAAARLLDASCADVALERLRENHAYEGSGQVSLNQGSCDYEVASLGGSRRSIVVSATVVDVVSRSRTTTESFDPLLIGSWQRIP